MAAALILYASQQGRSEQVARDIHAESVRRGLQLRLKCMDELGSDFLVTVPGVYVFVVSSTGDGEVPDNGRSFYKWLETQEDGELYGTRYALLGLGDSNYFKYQCAPKKLDRLLDSLGATSIVTRGAADEQEGLDKVIKPWVEGLWQPLTHTLQGLEDRYDPVRTLPAQVTTERPEVLSARVLRKRVLSEPQATKKVVELTFDTSGKSYSPGANISVYPENDPSDVAEVLQRLGFDANYVIATESFLPQAVRWRVQVPISLSEFFRRFVEVSGPVCKSFADYFCLSLENAQEKQQIRTIAEQSRKVTLTPPYSLLHLLRTFPRFRGLYLEETLPLLPPLRPRLYSISSSPLTSPNTVTIVFSVEGVCTRFMDMRTEGDLSTATLPISFGAGDSAFWKPIMNNHKVIVISTGVGLAPFKAILEQLSLTNTKRKLWIIHGCRQTEEGTSLANFDLIYKSEVTELVERTGGQLDLAASSESLHVQDIISAKQAELRQWSNAAILCGSFDIPQMKATLKSLNSGMMIVAEDWE